MTPDRPAADLPARYQAFSDVAPQVTSLLGDDGTIGLYPLVDSVIDEVTAASPPFACRAGCVRCCVTTAPLVTTVEWQAILRHLSSLEPGVRQAIRATADLLRPLREPLRQARDRLVQGHPLPADFGFQCPFLVGGTCAIYPVRPLICRTYGYMIRKQVQPDGTTHLLPLLSDLAQMHIHATWPSPDWPLPLHNPYDEQLQRLNAAAGGDHAFLPQWLWDLPDSEPAIAPGANDNG